MEIPKGKSVLVFAADADTEELFKKSISGEDVDIRKGSITDAVRHLAEHRSPELVIVDLADVPHPMGSIFELAEVCEFGTKVFAIGTDDSAALTRDLFQHGVSDYLAKPFAVSEIRGAIRSLLIEEEGGPERAGRVASFIGCGGGVGTTTLTCLTALEIAKRGGYVAVVDFSRAGSAISVLFEATIPAGLGEIMDSTSDVYQHTETLDGAKATLSDRITLFAYPPVTGAELPVVPDAATIEWLLDHLSKRYHMVLVDGLEDVQARIAAATQSDVNVLIYERAFSSVFKMKTNAGMLGLTEELGDNRAMVLVESNARSGKWVLSDEHMTHMLQGRNIDANFPFDQDILRSPDLKVALNLVQNDYKDALGDLADHVWGKAETAETEDAIVAVAD